MELFAKKPVKAGLVKVAKAENRVVFPTCIPV
jgi:hypothetical protein